MALLCAVRGQKPAHAMSQGEQLVPSAHRIGAGFAYTLQNPSNLTAFSIRGVSD